MATTQVRLTRKTLAKAIRNFLDSLRVETVRTPANLIAEGDLILIQGEVAAFLGTDPQDPKSWKVGFIIPDEQQSLLKGPWSTFERFVTPDQPKVSAVVFDLANALDLDRRLRFIEKWLETSRIPGPPMFVHSPVTHLMAGDVIRSAPSDTQPGREVIRIEDRDGQAAILLRDASNPGEYEPTWHVVEWATRLWRTRRYRNLD